MKRWIAGLALACSCMLMAPFARAQVPGALLDHGVVEAGMVYHDFDRETEFQNQKHDFENALWTVGLRMGVTGNFSASLELASGLGDVDMGNHSYTVGGSAQTLIWTNGMARVTTSVGYTRILAVYRGSGGPISWLVQSADWNALVDKPFAVHGQEITVWAGPTISYFTEQPQDPGSENKSASSQVLGGVVGTRILLQHHISITAQGTYVSAFEPALLLAYRF